MRRLPLCPALLALAACGPAPVTVDHDSDAAEDEAGTTNTTEGDKTESESSEGSSEGTSTEGSGDVTGDSGTDTGPPCDEVVGSVEVFSDEDIAKLECVREASSIDIRDTSITDLSILAKVEVLGTLRLGNNVQLASFTGADALVELDELSLAGSPLITDFASFPPVELSILRLGKGLTGLESVSADFSPWLLELSRWDQPGTAALADLQPGEHQGGFWVRLHATEGLEDLSGIAACCADPPLHVEVDSPGLLDFTGFESITELASLEVSGTTLQSFAGLENLSTVELFEVDEVCPYFYNTLTDFTGLTSLESVAVFRVRANALLLGFAGLDSLTSVGEIDIYNNDALLTLDMPPTLDVTGAAAIRDNDSLPAAEVQAFVDQSSPASAVACGNGEPADCVIEGPCPQ